ncbi:MAG: hypothetical protein CSB55_05935 [Candidatus Cloacimonadota bacterium]|nr:MAG: hypothetical protein CSB55_05935 [Candidatus Cloacimonadota bacterium]
MIRIAEELLLLALDDEKGVLVPMPFMALDFGLSAALLMEMELKGFLRVENEKIIVDDVDTGDDLTNGAKNRILKSKTPKSPYFWIKEIALNSSDLKLRTIKSLIDKKILTTQERKILWIIPQRRYPVINDKEEIEVRTRIRQIIYGGIKPTKHDIVLIGLILACDLVDEIFVRDEKAKAVAKLTELADLDLISSAVIKDVNDLQQIITSAVSSIGSGPPSTGI